MDGEDSATANPGEDISKWSVEDVCGFISSLAGCAEYTQVRTDTRGGRRGERERERRGDGGWMRWGGQAAHKQQGQRPSYSIHIGCLGRSSTPTQQILHVDTECACERLNGHVLGLRVNECEPEEHAGVPLYSV